MPGAADAASIEARTPPDRDRVVDLLRLGAIVLVVLGHWLVAVVLVRDDDLVTGMLLDEVPGTQLLTYVFQVMPLFFLVGGAVNLGSWQRAREAGDPWPVWVRRRTRRLLRPLLPLLLLWVPLAPLLAAANLPDGEVALASRTAFIPVWFLAVYVLVVSLVPLTSVLHRRFGVWVVFGAVLATVAIDVLEAAETLPLLGYLNYLFVWGGIHQIGYFWHEDRLPSRRWRTLGVAAGGVATLVTLVAGVGYPLSMIATQGADGNNTDPPTLALWALAVVQLGLVLAARPALDRWLLRPRVWAPVVRGGSVVMTVFLWHMTAMVLVVALTHPTGLWPATGEVDATWWVLRPLWVALCALALTALVAVFRRFEEAQEPVPRDARLRTVAGIVATVVGLALILLNGLYTPQRPGGVPFGVLGLLLLGLSALGVLRPRPTASAAPDGGGAAQVGGAGHASPAEQDEPARATADQDGR